MTSRRASVIGIGDELLIGSVVNSNAAMIGRLLTEAGCEVVSGYIVGDEVDRIVDILRQACAEAEFVVVTGGLGPTLDDRTRDAIAALLDVRLAPRQELIDELQRRFAAFGREMPKVNERQAHLPEGTDAIPNPVGTAPGISTRYSDSHIWCIPGVPREAEAMMNATVLKAVGGSEPRSVLTIRTVGLTESGIAQTLDDLASADDPAMASYPGAGEIRLRWTTSAANSAALETIRETVVERLGSNVYTTEDLPLEAVIGRLLQSAGLRVVAAESCTAGAVAARLSSSPGASEWFDGGVVTYTNAQKTRQLGVPPELIAEHGAVSLEVAEAMVLGVRERFSVDYGVAVTCAAGPDDCDGAKPGTTVVSVWGPKGGRTRVLRLPGDRAQVREYAATFALDALRRLISGV